MTDRPLPTTAALRAAFEPVGPEPEIDEATLFAYAQGDASSIDREIVESMLVADPSLHGAIETIRAEMAEAKEPLPELTARVPNTSPTPARLSWFLPGLGLAVAAAALAFAFVRAGEADAAARHLALAQRDAEESRRAAAASEDRAARLEVEEKTLREKAVAVQARNDALQRRLVERDRTLVAAVAERDRWRRVAVRSRPPVPPRGDDALALARRGSLLVRSFEPLSSLVPIPRGPAFAGTPSKTAVLGSPTLDWSDARDLPSGPYAVEVRDERGVVWKATNPNRRLAVPERVLRPGCGYAWRVSTGDFKSPPLGFVTLSAADAAEARRAPKDPLARGVLYARLGLRDDARRAFEALKVKDSALAARLLRALGP